MQPLVRSGDAAWKALEGHVGVSAKVLVTSGVWPAMSVHYLKVRPAGRIAMHAHEAQSETHFIVGGRGIARVGDAEYEVGPGDVLLAQPGVPHDLRNAAAEDLTLLCVFAPPLI